MTYAVVKHRLMEVNLAVRYGTIEALFGLLIGLPLVGLTIFIDTNLFTSIVIVSLVLFGARYFKDLRKSLTQAVDRLPMFRGRYERFGRLEALFSDISSTKTLVEWNDTVKDVAMILCPTETIALLVKDEPAKRFIARASEGFDQAEKLFLNLPIHSVLSAHLSKRRKMCIRDRTGVILRKTETDAGVLYGLRITSVTPDDLELREILDGSDPRISQGPDRRGLSERRTTDPNRSISDADEKRQRTSRRQSSHKEWRDPVYAKPRIFFGDIFDDGGENGIGGSKPIPLKIKVYPLFIAGKAVHTDKEEIFPVVEQAILDFDRVPVSYTHLDVYKRQHFDNHPI